MLAMKAEIQRRALRGTRRQLASRKPDAPPKPRRDKRFLQYLDMAQAGNAEAVADLWREYGFDFEREEP